MVNRLFSRTQWRSIFHCLLCPGKMILPRNMASGWGIETSHSFNCMHFHTFNVLSQKNFLLYTILIKGNFFFPHLSHYKLSQNDRQWITNHTLFVLWHILPLSFSKTSLCTLPVYPQAWITTNPCSGEGVYGVPVVQGLMWRHKVLFLWSHLRVSWPKGPPLLIKAIKYTLVLTDVRSFENCSPNDLVGCGRERTTLSLASPAVSMVKMCLLTPCEPGIGTSPWDRISSSCKRSSFLYRKGG